MATPAPAPASSLLAAAACVRGGNASGFAACAAVDAAASWALPAADARAAGEAGPLSVAISAIGALCGPIDGGLGDATTRGRVANVLTSAPFILLGFLLLRRARPARRTRRAAAASLRGSFGWCTNTHRGGGLRLSAPATERAQTPTPIPHRAGQVALRREAQRAGLAVASVGVASALYHCSTGAVRPAAATPAHPASSFDSRRAAAAGPTGDSRHIPFAHQRRDRSCPR